MNLFYAVQNGDAEIVEQLIKDGANVNVEVEFYTPLYVAIYNRDYRIVDFLLKAGANILFEGNSLSPLNVAAAKEDQIKDLVFHYYWKIVGNIQKDLPTDVRDFEVVVVRYNEDISWIAREFPQEKVIIYNKGKDDLILPTSNCVEVKIPNVGYLGGTYLYHIVNNYDHLANRTLFLQAYPYDHPLKMPLIRHKFESDSGCINILAKCTSPQDLKAENERIKKVKFGKFDHEVGIYNEFDLQSLDLMTFIDKLITHNFT